MNLAENFANKLINWSFLNFVYLFSDFRFKTVKPIEVAIPHKMDSNISNFGELNNNNQTINTSEVDVNGNSLSCSELLNFILAKTSFASHFFLFYFVLIQIDDMVLFLLLCRVHSSISIHQSKLKFL